MNLAPDTILGDRYRVAYLADERRHTPIYRAYDQQEGRRVLICGFAGEAYEPSHVAAIAHQLRGIDSAGMLPLLDHFAGEDAYYLVAEDPGGQDLDRLIREQGGPLPETALLAQSLAMLHALEQAHELQPPAHLGDLRSSDIWGTPEKELRLTPFAFVSHIGGGPSPYRAPELLAADAEPNPASDLYALGAAFYQLATGWSPPNVQQRQAGTPLIGPRQLNPALSPLADQAITRALEQRLSNRYHEAREMRQSFEMVQLMAGRSLGAGPDATIPVELVVPQMAQPTLAVAPLGAGIPIAPGLPAGSPPAPPPPYAPQVPYSGAAVARRGLGGCWIAAIVAFLLILITVCIAALLLVFGPGRPLFEQLLSQGRSTTPSGVPTAGPARAAAADPTAPAAPAATAAPTTGPVATAAPTANAAVPMLAPGAIGLANVATLTQTAELTSSTVGPAAWNPDGSLLAVARDARVDLLDATTYSTTGSLDAGGLVGTLAWSPDGTKMAVGSLGRNEVLVFDTASGQEAQRLAGHTDYIRSLAWSPDGATIASGSADTTIRLWDTASGVVRATLRGHTSLLGAVAWSPDSTTLASAGRDGTVRLWDAASGQPKSGWSYTTPVDPETRAPYWTTGVAWSPDGSLLAAGATDGIVRVWAVGDAKPKYELKGHTDWVVIRGLAFSPDGATLASGSRDGTVRLWSTASGRQEAVLEGHQLQVISIAWHPDGTRLLSTSDQDGRVLVWDKRSGSVAETFQLGLGVVTGLAWSPDGATLGALSIGGTLRVSGLDDGKLLELPGVLPVVQGVAFLPQQELAAISDQGQVGIWNLATGQQERMLEPTGAGATSVATSPDGSVIAVGSIDGMVTLWNADSGRPLARLPGLRGRVFRLSFSSDGGLLAAYSTDQGTTNVWNTGSGKLISSIERTTELTALAFVPGGEQLALADRSGQLAFYDALSGQELFAVAAPQAWFTALAFNPDGSVLAAGGADGSLYLYGTKERTQLTSFAPGGGDVLALAWSPEGRRIAFSGRDGEVRVMEARR